MIASLVRLVTPTFATAAVGLSCVGLAACGADNRESACAFSKPPKGTLDNLR